VMACVIYIFKFRFTSLWIWLSHFAFLLYNENLNILNSIDIILKIIPQLCPFNFKDGIFQIENIHKTFEILFHNDLKFIHSCKQFKAIYFREKDLVIIDTYDH
jgi:hypothetical protein